MAWKESVIKVSLILTIKRSSDWRFDGRVILYLVRKAENPHISPNISMQCVATTGALKTTSSGGLFVMCSLSPIDELSSSNSIDHVAVKLL